MKKLKKVFAVLLSLAMVLGMSMTSFAAETTTVTVKGLKAGVTVTYAKFAERKADGSGWALTENVGMTIDQIIAAGDEDKAATGKINTGLSGLNLADLTYGNAQTADEDGKVTFSNMEAGLYAIRALDRDNEYIYSDMVAFVGYTDGAITPATVTAKGESNQVDKVVSSDLASVAPGDEIEYTVSVKYPFFVSEAETNEFEITDTVENGEIDLESVVIPEGFGLEKADESTSTTLIVKLTGTYDAAKAGQSVVISYKVTAGDVTTENPLTNTAESKVNVNGTEKKSQNIVVTPCVDVEITKVDEAGETIEAEAVFALYEVTEDTTEGAEKIDTADKGEIWAKQVATANTVKGVAEFNSLAAKDGRYYVKETSAPEGYAIEPKAYPLSGATVDKGVKSEADTDVNGVRTITTTYTATSFNSVGMGAGLSFKDSTLSSLPSTGGIGTTIFTIGGCVIMIAAAALFFASRRKSAK